MRPAILQDLLAEVASGRVAVSDALARLQKLPYEELDVARIDHHRELRQGAPEVVLGSGKTPAQIASIAAALLAAGSNVLVTRAAAEAFAAVRGVAPDACYDELARLITVVRTPREVAGRATVVSAGTADLPVASEALGAARFFGIDAHLLADVGVAGLHRLLAHESELMQAGVVIVVAGMEGALPSVVGGLVAAPVIAVPTSVGYGASLGGLTALFAMLSSCAAGITVVNIDNGFGAAAAAMRILRLRDRPGSSP